MRIETIKTYEAFASLKEDWEAVYAADPEAQFFLSWTWLSIWLKGTRNWAVLIARPDASSPPVAFFPIRLQIKKTSTGGVIKEVVMAGSRAADYTGFICRPECEDKVIPVFAKSVQLIKWDQLQLENICLSPRRIRHFLSHFPPEVYDSKCTKIFNKNETTDHYVCPYVTLPESWESYVSNSLGVNTRQKVRRFLRKVDNSGDLRIACATAGTIDRDLNILLQLWTQKWGPIKGKDTLASLQSIYKTTLTESFEAGTLLLPVFWTGQTAVGALATFIDREKKSLLFYIGGRDESFKSLPAGFILHAWSLRFAINSGFKTYDFLRGNEPYKYVFGCQERQIRHIIVSVRSAEAVDAPGRSTPAHQPA